MAVNNGGLVSVNNTRTKGFPLPMGVPPSEHCIIFPSEAIHYHSATNEEQGGASGGVVSTFLHSYVGYVYAKTYFTFNLIFSGGPLPGADDGAFEDAHRGLEFDELSYKTAVDLLNLHTSEDDNDSSVPAVAASLRSAIASVDQAKLTLTSYDIMRDGKINRTMLVGLRGLPGELLFYDQGELVYVQSLAEIATLEDLENLLLPAIAANTLDEEMFQFSASNYMSAFGTDFNWVEARKQHYDGVVLKFDLRYSRTIIDRIEASMLGRASKISTPGSFAKILKGLFVLDRGDYDWIVVEPNPGRLAALTEYIQTGHQAPLAVGEVSAQLREAINQGMDAVRSPAVFERIVQDGIRRKAANEDEAIPSRYEIWNANGLLPVSRSVSQLVSTTGESWLGFLDEHEADFGALRLALADDTVSLHDTYRVLAHFILALYAYLGNVGAVEVGEITRQGISPFTARVTLPGHLPPELLAQLTYLDFGAWRLVERPLRNETAVVKFLSENASAWSNPSAELLGASTYEDVYKWPLWYFILGALPAAPVFGRYEDNGSEELVSVAARLGAALYGADANYYAAQIVTNAAAIQGLSALRAAWIALYNEYGLEEHETTHFPQYKGIVRKTLLSVLWPLINAIF